MSFVQYPYEKNSSNVIELEQFCGVIEFKYSASVVCYKWLIFLPLVFVIHVTAYTSSAVNYP